MDERERQIREHVKQCVALGRSVYISAEKAQHLLALLDQERAGRAAEQGMRTRLHNAAVALIDTAPELTGYLDEIQAGYAALNDLRDAVQESLKLSKALEADEAGGVG